MSRSHIQVLHIVLNIREYGSVFYLFFSFIDFILFNVDFLHFTMNSCTKKLIRQKHNTLIYVNKYIMLKIN